MNEAIQGNPEKDEVEIATQNELKQTNKTHDDLDLEGLNRKIELIKLQMTQSINSGFTSIMETINEKVNENKEKIVEVENRVTKVESFLTEKIPDGGLLSLEDLVDYHQEMEKTKNTILIKKPKDIQEAKEALQTLLPETNIENEVYFTTIFRELRNTNTEKVNGENTPPTT